MSDTPEERRRAMIARILTEQAATELDPTATWHGSADMAAIAALDAITDQEREHGGVLFRNQEGQYAYSLPVPGSGHDFSLRARFNPKQHSLAGIYHTHPAADDSHVFSPNDIETARNMNLASWIKVLANNEIRRFDPATSTARADRRSVARRRLVTSPGELVERPIQRDLN